MHIHEITANLTYSIFINPKISCVLCKLYHHPPASSYKQTLIGFLLLWLVSPVSELQTNSPTVWTLFCLLFFIHLSGFYVCIIVCNCRDSLVPQVVKSLPEMQETWVQSLGREDLLQKEMATHSCILAWKIPWMEEPVRLQSMGLQSWTWLRHFSFTFFFFHAIVVKTSMENFVQVFMWTHTFTYTNIKRFNRFFIK